MTPHHDSHEVRSNARIYLKYVSHNFIEQPRGSRYFSFSNLTNSPRSIDLRQRGMVTQVKDQGYTATGGIFSAIGALEAVHYRNTSKLQLVAATS